MTHFALVSVTLKSIAGAMVVALGVVGAHGSVSEAGGDLHVVPRNVVEHDGASRECRASGDDVGHDSHGNVARGSNGRTASGRSPSTRIQQVIVVQVPRTAFLRVDKSGHIIAAATNTGCRPTTGDDVFLFRPGGKIEPTTAVILEACDWTGDFAVSARFYPQDCTTNHHSRRPEDSY